MNRQLFQCPHCGCVGASSGDVEFFDLPLEDEDYVGEPEVTYFDEEIYESEDPSQIRREAPYPVRGDVIDSDQLGRSTTVQSGLGARTHGGIQVETKVNLPPRPQVRQLSKERQMVAPGQATPFRPKRRSLSSSQGVLVDPSNPMNDFDPSDGMSAVERFTDNGLQAAYEADLAARGFN